METTFLNGRLRPIPKHNPSDPKSCGNWDELDEATHNAAGVFYCLPVPEYDPDTHKLSEWVRDGDNWVRELIEKTPDEVAERARLVFESEMAVIDMEWTPRMYEDIWMVATGKTSYTDLKAQYKAATGKDELPIDALIRKKQDKRLGQV